MREDGAPADDARMDRSTSPSARRAEDELEGAPADLLPRLPIEVVRRLSKKSLGVTCAVLGFNYAVVALSVYLCERFWSVPAYVAAVVVIARRGVALGSLIHEGAHFLLTDNKAVNDAITRVFCCWPLLNTVPLSAYRKQHFGHHRHLNTPQDPDGGIYLRPLTGARGALQLAFTCAFAISTLFIRSAMRAPLQQVAAAAALALLFWWQPAAGRILGLYWAVPLLVVMSPLFYVRIMAEHSAVEADEPVFRSRVLRLTLLDRLFIAPAYTGYHLDHHLYPTVPFFRRHELHRALLSDPKYAASAHVTHGYLELLKEFFTYRGAPPARARAHASS